MKTLNSILEANGISNDAQQIVAIKNQLFDVVTLPKASAHEGFLPPNGINIYKSTGGACLGEAGDSYGVMQPIDFFETINQALKNIGFDFDKNIIEYLPTKNDQVISFKIPLTEIKFKNAAKRGDITEVYALFTTSFDGSQATSLNLFSKRVLCENMVLFTTQKDTSFKFRHTPKMNLRALTYVDAIMKSSKGIATYNDLFKELDKIEIKTERQINMAMESILGYSVSDFQALHVKRKAVVEGIRNGWALERERTGNTAFGLYNAFTYFANHDESGNTKSFEHVTFGTGAKLNKQAEKAFSNPNKFRELITI